MAAVLTLMCRSSATRTVRRNGGSAKNGFAECKYGGLEVWGSAEQGTTSGDHLIGSNPNGNHGTGVPRRSLPRPRGQPRNRNGEPGQRSGRDQLTRGAEPGGARILGEVAPDLRWLRAGARIRGVGQGSRPAHAGDEADACQQTAHRLGIARRGLLSYPGGVRPDDAVFPQHEFSPLDRRDVVGGAAAPAKNRRAASPIQERRRPSIGLASHPAISQRPSRSTNTPVARKCPGTRQPVSGGTWLLPHPRRCAHPPPRGRTTRRIGPKYRPTHCCLFSMKPRGPRRRSRPSMRLRESWSPYPRPTAISSEGAAPENRATARSVGQTNRTLCHRIRWLALPGSDRPSPLPYS